MRLLVTGAAGFLGGRLAREILRRRALVGADGARHTVERLVLFDRAPIAVGADDPRVEHVQGDIADASLLCRLLAPGAAGIFHLAALTSAAAERDFAAGCRINLDGIHALLEACRTTLDPPPRFVFSSSIAVYGGALPPVVPDDFLLRPHISYGVHKAIGELLVGDYSRKGFLDGRSVRLPTVLVREGSPDPAAANSDFVSAILREPLAGRAVTCPVAPETSMTLLSAGRAVAALIRAYELPAAAWGTERSLMLPTLDVPIGALAEAVRKLAGEAAFRRIAWRPDPAVERRVALWPKGFAATRARQMGFAADASAEAILAAYLADGQAGAPR